MVGQNPVQSLPSSMVNIKVTLDLLSLVTEAANSIYCSVLCETVPVFYARSQIILTATLKERAVTSPIQLMGKHKGRKVEQLTQAILASSTAG